MFNCDPGFLRLSCITNDTRKVPVALCYSRQLIHSLEVLITVPNTSRKPQIYLVSSRNARLELDLEYNVGFSFGDFD